jgi:hypothetical protein
LEFRPLDLNTVRDEIFEHKFKKKLETPCYSQLKIVKILNSLRACSDLYVHAEYTGQKLMRTLSILGRNWCARSACASEIIWCLASPKIKITSLYFSHKVNHPERLYSVKIMKIPAKENLTLGTFKFTFS